jgi:hypothetical protein
VQHLHDVGVRSGAVLQQLCSTQAAIASTCSFWGEACEIHWVMCGIGACGLRQVCQACELRQTANRRRQSPEPPAINCERLEIDLCIHKAQLENIQTYKPTHVRICKLSTTCIPYMSSALILVYGCWQPTHKHDTLCCDTHEIADGRRQVRTSLEREACQVLAGSEGGRPLEERAAALPVKSHLHHAIARVTCSCSCQNSGSTLHSKVSEAQLWFQLISLVSTHWRVAWSNRHHTEQKVSPRGSQAVAAWRRQC